MNTIALIPDIEFLQKKVDISQRLALVISEYSKIKSAPKIDFAKIFFTIKFIFPSIYRERLPQIIASLAEKLEEILEHKSRNLHSPTQKREIGLILLNLGAQVKDVAKFLDIATNTVSRWNLKSGEQLLAELEKTQLAQKTIVEKQERKSALATKKIFKQKLAFKKKYFKQNYLLGILRRLDLRLQMSGQKLSAKDVCEAYKNFFQGYYTIKPKTAASYISIYKKNLNQ